MQKSGGKDIYSKPPQYFCAVVVSLRLQEILSILVVVAPDPVTACADDCSKI